jgi:DNA-binding IclR family transcriptional regulator
MPERQSIDGISRVPESASGKDRQFVTALARGLEILRCFNPGERFLGVSELSRRTGLPKPTVSRLAGTLTKLGYLSFSGHYGQYQLAPGVLSLGYAFLSNVDIRQIARPMMQELAESSQTSTSLAIGDRLSLVYVETVRSSASIGLQLGIGSRLPMATTATGRAYLAGCLPREREILMTQLKKQDPENWPAILTGIEQGLKDFKDRGFCISIKEWNKDVSGVGVPFHAPDGTLMAFNCAGPAFLLQRKKLIDEIGPRLVALVGRLGKAMGRDTRELHMTTRTEA